MANLSLCCLLNNFYNFIYDFIATQSVFLLIIAILLSFLLVANFHYAKQLCDVLLITSWSENGKYDFDYTRKKGPQYWKNIFPAARGCFQSPINIVSQCSSILRMSEPLIWNHYDEVPLEMFITNTGHTVELRANYSCNTPTLSGADLLECYSFISLCFRWSLFDDEGSEHMINNRKYPVELQVSHMSRDSMDLKANNDDLGILIVAYFFSITRNDNPFLDPIAENLFKIQKSGESTRIPSFPLSWLCYPFRTDFYSYGGSLTEPPCSEGVTWFVHPDPIAISIRQLEQFRSLLSKDGTTRIIKNSRPVQKLNLRVICYNKQFLMDNCVEDATD